MKRKYKAGELIVNVPRYVSEERKKYLEEQEELRKAKARLEELEKKIKEAEAIK